MCKRDSLQRSADEPGGGPGGCGRCHIAVGVEPGGAAATGPVSYTHLRAHETVLDLVCRLLLEKKKIQEIKTTYNH